MQSKYQSKFKASTKADATYINYETKKLRNQETKKLRNSISYDSSESMSDQKIVNDKNENANEEIFEAEVWPTFDDFWDGYQKKIGRDACLKKWSKLKQIEKEKIMEFLPAYIESTPEVKYRKNPQTFLNQKSWNDEIITKEKQREQFADKQANEFDELEAIIDKYYPE